MDVQTTSCAYWVSEDFILSRLLRGGFFERARRKEKKRSGIESEGRLFVLFPW